MCVKREHKQNRTKQNRTHKKITVKKEHNLKIPPVLYDTQIEQGGREDGVRHQSSTDRQCGTPPFHKYFYMCWLVLFSTIFSALNSTCDQTGQGT